VLHFQSDQPKRFKTPIVFVYALIGAYYIMDLSEEKSFVRYLLHKGFDVYMVDWGKPSKVEGKNGIGDYIEKYLNRGIDKVLEISGTKQINLFGYCLGAMMSLIYTAAHQDKVKNLSLLTPPVDFEDDGLLTRLTDERYLDVDRIVRHFDHLIPANFIQAGFDLKNVVGSMMSAYSLWNIMWNKKALENFYPMDHWVHDNVPMSSTFWKEYITKFYVKNQFMSNTFFMNGKHLDMKKITCPVLTVAATRDDIVTPKCAEGSLKIIGSKDKTMMMKKGGHVGVLVGSMAKNEVWPDIFSWLSSRSERIAIESGDTLQY
jgi:polyhydroxyalkanoate synthase